MKRKSVFLSLGSHCSRRDFFGAGIGRFYGTLLAPSLITHLMLQQRARAEGLADQGQDSDDGLMPFLVFDMRGGAAFPGNFLVGKEGGPEDFLNSYDELGWDPRAGGALDKRFGLPMAANASKILEGIVEAASPAAQAGLRMGSLCNFSVSDTSSNPLSALTLVSKAGYRGVHLANGLGTGISDSGGYSKSALEDSLFKPLQLKSVNDVGASLGYGPVFRDFSDAKLKAMGRAIRDMSWEQSARFDSLKQGAQLAALADAGYDKNMQNGSRVSGIDPRMSDVFRELYDINAGTDEKSNSALSASVVMNVLNRSTGPGALMLDDCDYHDGNSTKGDRQDKEMGLQIGRAVEASYRLKKPLFFQLITDGGIYADKGTRNWRGDANTKSMTVIGHYHPTRTPSLRRVQLGSYLDGQSVNPDTFVGSESALGKIAYVVLANYLFACGKLGSFEAMLPRGLIEPKQFDDLLLFG